MKLSDVSFPPDAFFSLEQQERLSELMGLWRSARDQGRSLPPDQQIELNNLVEVELCAATARTETEVELCAATARTETIGQ